ncbi:hypothetical protein [Candidatus Clostridium helianthi]|uniref:Apea-like HEPN domain-containing protein n=1 Tax=Candidatus Clostridium helianthi TaxID=3381660 RepID=A0ABW8SDJ3_9CLOT
MLNNRKKFVIIIECTFKAAFNLDDLNFELDNIVFNFKFEREEFHLSFQIYTDINSYEELSKGDSSCMSNIRGWINRVLPYINNKVYELKYLDGHILIDTFSMLDIRKIEIRRNRAEKGIVIEKPFSIPSFPPTKALAKENDNIFIRDYIDSMTCYYKYNLDECIRKIITSLENYYSLNKIKGENSKINKKGTFLAKTEELLSNKDNFILPENILKIAYNNIWILYKIRNKIVHDHYRLDYDDRWVCSRGINTLYNVFNNKINKEEMSRYIMTLNMQFGLLDSVLSNNEFLNNYSMEFTTDEIKKISLKFKLNVSDLNLR